MAHFGRIDRSSREAAWRLLSSISAAFSPDGGLLATSGNDGTVRIWRPATGERLASLAGLCSCLPRVGFSADGRTLAAAGFDNHVRLWDVDDIIE